jgi:hypothetical protein
MPSVPSPCRSSTGRRSKARKVKPGCLNA